MLLAKIYGCDLVVKIPEQDTETTEVIISNIQKWNIDRETIREENYQLKQKISKLNKIILITTLSLILIMILNK